MEGARECMQYMHASTTSVFCYFDPSNYHTAHVIVYECMYLCTCFLFSPFQQRPNRSSAVADKECQDRWRYCKGCSAMGLWVCYCTCAIEMESESLEWEGVRERRDRERVYKYISVDPYILLALSIRPSDVHGQNLVRHCSSLTLPLAYGLQIDSPGYVKLVTLINVAFPWCAEGFVLYSFISLGLLV